MCPPSSRYMLIAIIAFSFAFCSAAVAQPLPTECGGQGSATLLMKGSCAIGGQLKIKMAGEPNARYKLWMDRGAGPVEVPGIGTFCLEFGPDKIAVSKGRFNARGLKSLFSTIPKDPKLVGEVLAFQFAAEEEGAPNGIAISNAYIFQGCKEESLGDCEQGIRRLGYFTIINYDGGYPVDITSRAFRAGDGGDASGSGGHMVGEVSLSYDPDSPPAFPLSANGTGNNEQFVTSVDAYPGFLVVHAVSKGCEWANGRLPNECVFETRINGEVAASVQIHTSCSVPISAGSRFPPVFISFFQDVGTAPDSDCD